ncbi:MAG: hypothetical protein ACOCXQ_04060 [Patescibacteria group bacterium]
MVDAEAGSEHDLDVIRKIGGKYYLFYYQANLPNMYLCEDEKAIQAAVVAGVKKIPVDDDGVRYSGYGVSTLNNELGFFIGYPADELSVSRIFYYPLAGIPVPPWLRLRLPQYACAQAIIARQIWKPMHWDKLYYQATDADWRNLLREGGYLIKRGSYREMRVIVPINWHHESGWDTICFRAFSIAHLANELAQSGMKNPERCHLFINLVGEANWHYVHSLNEVMTHGDIARQRRVTVRDVGNFQGDLEVLWHTYVG